MINEQIKSWKEYLYPHGYEVVNGILQTDGENFVSGTPFVLCAKTPELSGGSRFYMIRYDFDGKQKEFLASTNDLQIKRKCAALLASHAFKINDGSKFGRVTDYITRYQVEYGSGLKTIYAFESNGWNEDFTIFAIGNKGITKDGVIPVYTTLTNPKHVDVFDRRGSEQGWIEAVKPILNYDLVRFLFYDSMTASLLKILGLESHTFEHTGKTRSGKTTVSRVIASAIGNPTEQLMIPASSEKGLLAHINVMCDIPTFIEEATSTRAKQVTRSAIYEIANGMEKARAQIDGKLREDVKTFRAVTHITCEGSVREEMEHAGEMYRLNSLDEMLPYFDGVWKINRGIEENYGFFFIRYVQEIIKEKENLRKKLEEFLNLIEIGDTNNRNLVESSRNLYAGIMVAGYLCERVFVEMGIEEKNFKKLVQEYFDKCVLKESVELDHIRALRMINDWVLQNEMSFLHRVDEIQDLKVKEPFGLIIEGEVRIVGKQFTKIMKEWGFNSPANIAKCLMEEGITRSNGKKKGKCTFNMNGGSTEGVVIKRAKMEIKLGFFD